MSKPLLIAWASRGAGVLAVVSAPIHFFVASTQDGVAGIVASSVVIAGVGVAAFSADRFAVSVGRRVIWLAFAFFFVAGVLTIFGVGLLLLLSAVLAIFSLSRARGSGVVASVSDGFDGEWQVSALELDSGESEPIEGNPLVVRIAGQNITGSAGVNRFSGKVEGRTVVETLASTRMAGRADLMEQEHVFLGLLAGSTLQREGTGLQAHKDGKPVIWLVSAGI